MQGRLEEGGIMKRSSNGNTVTMNHEDILNFNLIIVLSFFFFLFFFLSHLIGMTLLFSPENGGFYGLYFIVFNVWGY